jgi:hypothetical protein
MTCDQMKDLILFYAGGAAEPAERATVERHLLDGCPVCAGRLAEARAVLAPLPLMLAPVVPAPAVRDRLMARVATPGSQPIASLEAQRHPAPQPDRATVVPFPSGGATRGPSGRAGAEGVPPLGARDSAQSVDMRMGGAAGYAGSSRSRSWLVPAIAAGLAAAIGGLGVYIPMHRDTLLLQAELATQASRMLSLESDVKNAASTVRMLRSPAVQVVSLGGAETPQAAGRIFWDRPRGEWRFYAADLKPPGPGRTYELWFITADQKKIPAGTFNVDASGEGELVVKVPEGVGKLALAAVTDEPEGGVPQPTGKIHLVGNLPG